MGVRRSPFGTLFQSAATLFPASGATDGIHRPYTLMIMARSLWPIMLATHTGLSPALNSVDSDHVQSVLAGKPARTPIRATADIGNPIPWMRASKSATSRYSITPIQRPRSESYRAS